MVRIRETAIAPLIDFQDNMHAVLYGAALVLIHRTWRDHLAALTVEECLRPKDRYEDVEAWLIDWRRQAEEALRDVEAVVDRDCDNVCGLSLVEVEQSLGPELKAMAQSLFHLEEGLRRHTRRRALADGLNMMHAELRIKYGKLMWR